MKNKHIGRYTLITLCVIFLIFVHIKTYEVITDKPIPESGIVLGKNDILTTGKHPRQKYIISFKYDNPDLGTKDIDVAFSTWNNLSTGDRTSFKIYKSEYKSHSEWMTMFELLSLLITGFFYMCLLSAFFVYVIPFIWKH